MTRLVFMGTPHFAVPTLHALCETYDLVGVYTQPDRPAGRGKQLAMSPIKQAALARNLPIFQPKTLRSAAVQAELRDLQPECLIVAAYGLILPQAVLDIPRHGCLNVHASLLPKYRGASPIAGAILGGETETGITIMLMDAGLDTGPILNQMTRSINTHYTTGTLEAKLSVLGAILLRETLPRWLNGDLTPQPQDESRATLTKLIAKEDGSVNWSHSAVTIARQARAYNPWPTAQTTWRGQALKILRATPRMDIANAVGHVMQHDGAILVGAGEGCVQLNEVQLAGKRAMNIAEFVRGHREFVGSPLGNTLKVKG
jgi:methionyl-tRNA formyltransferase